MRCSPSFICVSASIALIAICFDRALLFLIIPRCSSLPFRIVLLGVRSRRWLRRLAVPDAETATRHLLDGTREFPCVFSDCSVALSLSAVVLLRLAQVMTFSVLVGLGLDYGESSDLGFPTSSPRATSSPRGTKRIFGVRLVAILQQIGSS